MLGTRVNFQFCKGAVSFSAPSWGSAAALSLGCETDFAAKSDTFCVLTQNLIQQLSVSPHATVGTSYPYARCDGSIVEKDGKMKALWEEAVLGVRENMKVRDAAVIEGKESYFTSYLHSKLTANAQASGPGVGKTGALVEMSMIEPSDDREKDQSVLEEAGRKLAMHIVAMKPLFLSAKDIPSSMLEEEKGIFLKQIEDEEAAQGKKPKPQDIREKIVSGKLNKWSKGIALLEQEHVASGEENGGAVKKILKASGIRCNGFILL